MGYQLNSLVLELLLQCLLLVYHILESLEYLCLVLQSYPLVFLDSSGSRFLHVEFHCLLDQLDVLVFLYLSSVRMGYQLNSLVLELLLQCLLLVYHILESLEYLCLVLQSYPLVFLDSSGSRFLRVEFHCLLDQLDVLV